MAPRPAWSRLGAVAVLALAALVAGGPTHADPDGWMFATDGAGTTGGISGLAPLLPASGLYLAVHDAKQHDGAGPRVRRLTRLARGADGSMTTRPVVWPGTSLSNDLEAAAAVPGRPFEVVVVESGGAWTCLRFTQGGCCGTPMASGALSGGAIQIEGFAFAPSSAGLMAVWAGRGEGDTPALLYVARARTDRCGRLLSIDAPAAPVPVRAPTASGAGVPPAAPRHVGDLAILGAEVWATSAIDEGDHGRFWSQLYRAGRLVERAGTLAFEAEPVPVAAQVFPGHKTEAITPLPSGWLLGTDNEAYGGWLRALAR